MVFVAQLPTTISGKIMRRVLRDVRVNGEISGDRTSLENAGSIELAKDRYRQGPGLAVKLHLAQFSCRFVIKV